MTYDQYVLLSFQFHNNGFQSNDNISVTLSPAIPVIELVGVTVAEIFGEFFFDLFVGHAIADTGIELVESFPLEFIVRQTFSGLNCSAKSGRPNCQWGPSNTGFDEVGECFCVLTSTRGSVVEIP